MSAFLFRVLAGLPQDPAIAPLPAEPPIGGVLWSVIVPALLLALATAATVALYRHFARGGGDGAG